MNTPSLMTTLAQGVTGPPAPTTTPQPGGSMFLFPAMLFAMLIFIFLNSRSQRKREKREKEELYAGLAKNQRVQTVGGVIGTIVSVKEHEVVLKVDESTNTKMTFIKTAIQRVVTEDSVGETTGL